jgi:uncharacterized protein YjbI with pentapeptide repeats
LDEGGGCDGCPVNMQSGKSCGRAIHPVSGCDDVPVCLMHSLDPDKNDSDFQREFEAILEAAGDGVADCTSFVFPSAKYESREFRAECVFEGATFTQDSDFRFASFNRDVTFKSATFRQDANFYLASFKQEAVFMLAMFMRNANFVRARFQDWARFIRVTFADAADFGGATFSGTAYFWKARFAGDANFYKATFMRFAFFREVKFLQRAEFRHTTFRNDATELPGPSFPGAEFAQPEKVVFYKTYLGQALFYSCDVSKVTFSSVDWRLRKGTKVRKVFDEDVDVKNASGLKLRDGNLDERDYRLIAELYQQLKKNYDERKDYWTAGDFHYGEMEMKRLHSDGKRPPVRWLHRHLGLVALYRYASRYGESYMQPALWFLAVLLIFALLYPAVGLRDGSARYRAMKAPEVDPVLSYTTQWASAKTIAGRTKGELSLFGNSFLAAAEIATFQKEPAYQPLYPNGRVLAVIETLLTSTLAALFFLAVRRQFRR